MDTVNIPDYVAGDSLVFEFEIRTKTGGSPDLTGATIKYGVAPISIRNVIGTALFTKTVGSGITVLSATSPASVRVVVAKGDIPTPGEYWHEMELTLASLESYTTMGGRITAKQALFPNP
jgi:hypothetical protein